MSDLYLNNTNLNEFTVGNTTVNSMYVGSNLVYENFNPVSDGWYGVYFGGSSTTGTRIADSSTSMEMHKTLPIQSLMKGCTITSDGTVKYLNPNDWNHYEDGSDVPIMDIAYNFMVELPEFYYYTSTTAPDGSIGGDPMDFCVCISLNPNLTSEYGTWKKFNKSYVGAYEGFIYSGKLLSSQGRYPTNNTSREVFQSSARENDPSSNHWNMYTYEIHKAICWLFVVEYANRNSQDNYNAELTSEGYRQGGLGLGVTTGNGSSHTYNYCITASTNEFGNGTGVTQKTFEGVSCGVPRYRGIENPFGSLYKNCIDVKFYEGTMYKCEDYNSFNSNSTVNNDAYVNVATGLQANSQWQVRFKNGEICAPIYSSVTGSNSTFWCDYIYISNSSNYRTLLLGGYANVGSNAGLFCCYCNYSLGYSHSYVGTRLTYLI